MARTVGTALGFGLAPMAEATFPDEWLVQSLEGLVDAERLAELRGKADPAKTLWETLVAAKICTDEQINARLDELYRPDKAINKLLSGMEASADIVQLADQLPAEEIKITEEEASQRPVVRLVDMIISEGILQRSSDIHIEPEEGGVA